MATLPLKIQQYVDQSLLLALGATYDAIWRDLNGRLRAEECNLLQALVLMALFFEPVQDVSPSVLAKLFRTTRGNVSHCITQLERRGHLRRVLHTGDARRYRLTLRHEGKKTAVRLITIFDGLEGRFEKSFGAEHVSRLIRSLRGIEHAYGEKTDG